MTTHTRDAGSLSPPSTLEQRDKQILTLRVITRLRPLFGARGTATPAAGVSLILSAMMRQLIRSPVVRQGGTVILSWTVVWLTWTEQETTTSVLPDLHQGAIWQDNDDTTC
ncbi:hypothetical protein L210DRAFT_3520101, partial [Boletus edulis BED1]